MVVLCRSLTGIRFQVKLLHLILVPNLSPNTIQTGNTLHPRKLRWNLKMNGWKIRFLLGNIIFRFHVSFRGSVSFSLTHRGNARVYQHSSFKDTKTMLLRIEMRKIRADPSWSWPNCSSICRNFSSLDAWREKKRMALKISWCLVATDLDGNINGTYGIYNKCIYMWYAMCTVNWSHHNMANKTWIVLNLNRSKTCTTMTGTASQPQPWPRPPAAAPARPSPQRQQQPQQQQQKKNSNNWTVIENKSNTTPTLQLNSVPFGIPTLP